MMERNTRARMGQSGMHAMRRGCGTGCGMGHGPADLRGSDPITRRSENGCGACDCESGNANQLLRELQKIDFSLIDLVLYLDTNPECEQSRQMYQSLKMQKEQLTEKLAHAGYPQTSQSVHGGFEQWTKAPWPWEYAAN